MSYATSSLPLPTTMCRKIDGLLRDFWWSHADADSNPWYLKSRDSICLPKQWGGLGVRRTKEANLVLLRKWGWKCITKKIVCNSLLS